MDTAKKITRNVPKVGAMLLMLTTSLLSNSTFARESIGATHRVAAPARTADAGCGNPVGRLEMDLSGVRALILTGGDMFWDEPAGNAMYEVPKQDDITRRRTAIFAAELWIGGYDNSNQLKLAGQTYRQSGNDFWPGPLDTTTATITPDECVAYDRIWKVNKTDVVNFHNGSGAPTPDMLSWPGNGDIVTSNPGKTHFLAPYQDVDNNGYYDPSGGDYPRFNLSSTPLTDYKSYLLGDQVLWWVFNDKGNTHTESHGAQIGLEIQAQAFEFNKPASDPVSVMSFYTYKIINRSSNQLNQTYFGVFCDADLGYYGDDFVGCDANLGLGFDYNGKPLDQGNSQGYNDPPFDGSIPPPAIGMDFFEGPAADANSTYTYDPRSITKDVNGISHIGMAKFCYFTNGGANPQGDPSNAQQFYNYLIGKWQDGRPITYGGTGLGGSDNCSYMFPDSSDLVSPTGQARAPWSEYTKPDAPGDRRFEESAGPFTLKPGAVNYVTYGLIFGRATAGGTNVSSIAVLKQNDQLAQSLFDNHFNTLNGPTAPTLDLVELDKQIVITISNPQGNAAAEKYFEKDPSILEGPLTKGTSIYTFQGYQIFQLKSSNVSNIFDPQTGALDQTKAVVVAQCDIADGLGLVDNYVLLQNGNHTPVPMVYTAAEPANNNLDKGIKHTFVITQDQFNTSDPNKKLVNNITYYYYVVAYATNKQQYLLNLNLQTLVVPPVAYFKPYVFSSGLNVYQAIPHIPTMENGGMVLHSQFGQGVPVTRITGSGNGLNPLKLDSLSIIKILANNKLDSLKYASGGSPISITVIDPTKVPTFDLSFKLTGTTPQSSWTISQIGQPATASQSLSVNTDCAISKWGLSVTVFQTANPGQDALNNSNDYIPLPQPIYSDTTNHWLANITEDPSGTALAVGALADNSTLQYDWVASTKRGRPDSVGYTLDPLGFFQTNAINFAPFALCRFGANYPGVDLIILDSAVTRKTCFAQTSSVLLVISPNKNEWTQSPVIETSENNTSTIGLKKFTSKMQTPSSTVNGQPAAAMGLGWFPGYAIDMSTGERLNIIFGEASDNGTNGKDMLWNPSSDQVVSVQGDNGLEKNIIIGGKHFVYILGHNGVIPAYSASSAATIANMLSVYGTPNFKAVYASAMWTMIPVLAKGKSMPSGVPPTKVTFRLLAGKSFAAQKYTGDNSGALPSYIVNSKDLGAVVNNAKAAKDGLALIKVVPNPYYAHSAYESTTYDNFVKITNLPGTYTISIFSVDGTLIRTITSTNPNPTTAGNLLDVYNVSPIENAYTWDLKNNAGITVASGVYLIHIKADGIGEKTIKWFGVIRPLDVQGF